MVGQGRRALLGRIAEFGWFMQQGEPAATKALAMLFEDEPVRAAFLRHLEKCTETELGAVTYFVAEAVQEDGSRPDLEGRDDEGRPLVVVEAKFGAALGLAQVRGYLADQSSRLESPSRGAFVLLVPRYRVGEARNVLKAVTASEASFGSHWMRRSVVLSWDDCISLCEQAVSGMPDGNDIASDLAQFRAMCMTLGGLVIAPLGRVSFGAEWRDREHDLRQLIREATEHFVPPGARFPMASEVGYEHRRYIPGGTTDDGPACSVGIGTRFADDGQTPFWLRYHRRTPDFELVKARLSRSQYSSRMRTDGRHVWLPLDARPDAAGPELVQDLIAQISNIIMTASAG